MPELHFVIHVFWWHVSPHAHSLFAVHDFTHNPVSGSQGHVPSHFKIDLLHPINGFPLNPALQLHWTPWLMTMQSAHGPHVVAPSQGATIFNFMQWLLRKRFNYIKNNLALPLHCLSIHASLSGHEVSLRHPPMHKRFSHIWFALHFESELHTALQIPLWHRSSDKHCKSLYIRFSLYYNLRSFYSYYLWILA